MRQSLIDADEVDCLSHVVNFSGGRTSAYLVWLFEQRKKHEDINVEYIYCDTGAEHPNTYKFIRDVVEHFGIELTCLRNIISAEQGVGVKYRVVSLSECKQDLVPFNDYIKVYGTPTVVTAKCTELMKSRPCDKYCNEKYGRGNYVKWLGIRADEPNRIRIVDNQIDLFGGGKKVYSEHLPLRYLGQISEYTKQDVLTFWKEMPFDLDLPEHLGNCVFCVKKGAIKIGLAAKQEPEMATAFSEMLKSPKVKNQAGKEAAGLSNDQVYRGRLSLDSIIKTYEEFTDDELTERLERGKRLDTGSCSESCEAMTLDLFEGDE
jgi:hypothetical protein